MAMANRSMEKWLAVPSSPAIFQIDGFCDFRVFSNGHFGWQGGVGRVREVCLDGKRVELGRRASTYGRNMRNYVFWKHRKTQYLHVFELW